MLVMGCLHSVYISLFCCLLELSSCQFKAKQAESKNMIQEFRVSFEISDTATWKVIPLQAAFFANREIIAEFNVTDVSNPNQIAFFFETRFEGKTQLGRPVTALLGYYSLFPADKPCSFLLPLGKSCAKATRNPVDTCIQGQLIIEMKPTVERIPLREIQVKAHIYGAVSGE